MRHVSVSVEPDHLQRLASTSRPLSVVAEMVWNGLDAEAENVTVQVGESSMGAPEILTVVDDGHGMTNDEAADQFGRLGGSWKRDQHTSRNGTRILHGDKGQGRFRAFAIARKVQWVTVADNDGTRERTVIESRAVAPNDFVIHDPEPTDESTGTTVTLTLNDDASVGSLLREGAADDLAFLLALYLEKYPTVTIGYNGSKVHPAGARKRKNDYILTPDETGSEHPAELTVIEWTRNMGGRSLVLCNEDGLALAEQQPGIQAPGFQFTAYLKSPEFAEIGAETLDAGAGLHPRVQPMLEAAKDQLRTHFRERTTEEARDRVRAWKREKVYPYKGEPTTTVERTERQVFDMVALSVSDHLASFEVSDTKSKRLSMRLIREALERNPGNLHLILGEVLELPEAAQNDLASLLKQTSLTAVITAAKVVADRLDFLTTLQRLVFHEDTASRTLERAHLHELVAEETWIFGEQFALSVSDRSLTEVLRKHVGDDKELAGGPVLRNDGRAGRVDLMLSRRIPQPQPEQLDHIVVELKRPNLRVGTKELDQLKSYARAVAADPRFAQVPATWNFWLVTVEADDDARDEASQKDRAPGLVFEKDNMKVWLRTWGSLINDARSRLELFQKELDYSSDHSTATAFVRQKHSERVPNIALTDDGTAQAS